MEKLYKIGEMAKLCDVSMRTLRYYEELGLISPTKIDEFTGYRYYNEENLKKVKQIVKLKNLSFSLDEIRNFDTHSFENKKNQLESQIKRLRETINTISSLNIEKGEISMKKEIVIEKMSGIEKELEKTYNKNFAKSAFESENNRRLKIYETNLKLLFKKKSDKLTSRDKLWFNDEYPKYVGLVKHIIRKIIFYQDNNLDPIWNDGARDFVLAFVDCQKEKVFLKDILNYFIIEGDKDKLESYKKYEDLRKYNNGYINTILDCEGEKTKLGFFKTIERRINDYLKKVEATNSYFALPVLEISEDERLLIEAKNYDFGRNNYNKNHEKAFELYLQSAELGNIKATKSIGDCYYYGEGVTKDYKMAVKYYELASSYGSSGAKNNLGFCYYVGNGVEKDLKKAFALFDCASRENVTEAFYNLGECYFYGDGVTQNFEKAVELYKKAGEKGNIGAITKLGICYFFGYGVEKDYKKSVECFTLATKGNDDLAQLRLAECYYFGLGVEKDLKKAIKYYKLSADQGNDEAQNILGSLYFMGEGVKRNYKKAFELFSASKEQGNIKAMGHMALCYVRGYGVERDIKKSLELFELSAKQENFGSLVLLGALYFDGKYVETNYTKSKEYFEKALEIIKNDDMYDDEKKKIISDIENTISICTKLLKNKQ